MRSTSFPILFYSFSSPSLSCYGRVSPIKPFFLVSHRSDAVCGGNVECVRYVHENGYALPFPSLFPLHPPSFSSCSLLLPSLPTILLHVIFLLPSPSPSSPFTPTHHTDFLALPPSPFLFSFFLFSCEMKSNTAEIAAEKGHWDCLEYIRDNLVCFFIYFHLGFFVFFICRCFFINFHLDFFCIFYF